MTGPLLLAIDEGTTSARAIAFDLDGCEVASCQRPLTPESPRPGCVEIDADRVWREVEAAVRTVVGEVGSERIAAIGVTNQRETVVFWDRDGGAALGPAIVWQDRRGTELCRRLVEAGEEPAIQARTGLVLDPYFSATKIAWALEHRPEVRRAADAGTLRIGTIDSWIVHKLTRGELHVTDASNASRTLLMDLARCEWDPGLVARFGVPTDALATIVDSAGAIGPTTLFGTSIPITAIIGDQQAAFVGQGCASPGQAKATYGTGAFLLAHAGSTPPASAHRLLATVAYRIGDATTYALEGSIFSAGDSARWLKERVRFLPDDADLGSMAAAVPDNGGVAFVPALTGLGAPHWRPDARAALVGLSTATTPEHIARACLEAMAQGTADLVDAFAADGVAIHELRIGGGMSRIDWLAQNLADTLGVAVERPREIEATALGAAMLAGVGAGVFGSLADAAAMRAVERRFDPAADAGGRAQGRRAWVRAVGQVLAGD